MDASDYVLLHLDTGSALYTTRATAAEIHQAHQNLKRAGQRPLGGDHSPGTMTENNPGQRAK